MASDTDVQNRILVRIRRLREKDYLASPDHAIIDSTGSNVPTGEMQFGHIVPIRDGSHQNAWGKFTRSQLIKSLGQ